MYTFMIGEIKQMQVRSVPKTGPLPVKEQLHDSVRHS